MCQRTVTRRPLSISHNSLSRRHTTYTCHFSVVSVRVCVNHMIQRIVSKLLYLYEVPLASMAPHRELIESVGWLLIPKPTNTCSQSCKHTQVGIVAMIVHFRVLAQLWSCSSAHFHWRFSFHISFWYNTNNTVARSKENSPWPVGVVRYTAMQPGRMGRVWGRHGQTKMLDTGAQHILDKFITYSQHFAGVFCRFLGHKIKRYAMSVSSRSKDCDWMGRTAWFLRVVATLCRKKI